MDWLYEVPNWVCCLLFVGATCLIGVGGLLITARWTRKLHSQQSHNDIIGHFLNVTGIIYGIALGLIAVATWQSYSNTAQKADLEAASVAAVYRDVTSLPEPARSSLQDALRKYTKIVIQESWPQQRRGYVPDAGTEELNVFQSRLDKFEPATEGQKALYSESLTAFNHLVELRRMRMEAATAGLPLPIWVVVIAGMVITLGVTWFMSSLRFSVHLWMTLLLCVFLGLVIQLMFRLDRPYRGQYGISPAAYENVYRQLMQ